MLHVLLHNSVELAQPPQIIKWTNTEIKAVMPAYPELQQDGKALLNISVGGVVGGGASVTYQNATGAPGTVTLIAGSTNPGANGALYQSFTVFAERRA